MQLSLWMRMLVAAMVVVTPAVARAQGHSYVNMMRSSTVSHVFVQQSVDGEYGKYLVSTKPDAEGRSVAATKQAWKGYGIGTSLGIELMKFIQFTAGHTFVNMRYKDDALERLTGSRLNAGMRLVFQAPVVNLELGGGLQGSRLDYQKQLENASLYGSGYYYSLGLNYFMSSRVSLYYEAKMTSENLVANGGSSRVDAVQANMTLMGLGFRIWL